MTFSKLKNQLTIFTSTCKSNVTFSCIYISLINKGVKSFTAGPWWWWEWREVRGPKKLKHAIYTTRFRSFMCLSWVYSQKIYMFFIIYSTVTNYNFLVHITYFGWGEINILVAVNKKWMKIFFKPYCENWCLCTDYVIKGDC